MAVKVVVDTNVFVSAVMSANGASRQVMRLCLQQRLSPLMANALFSEYEDVCARDALFDERLITPTDRYHLLDAFLACCTWVPIYFLWRPNLRDEADNHVLELAIAGGADCVITSNKKDFRNSELSFPHIEICNPVDFLEKGLFAL
ncbi:MAG: putative toxin-antitoxin system toxin component, PIN family [Alphaproteobacteria bacterium]|nr:putative toxin-antitoxin system toxin component, PIN family [Alphaproteobacteria bacterium]